jgi:DNA-nicking Smr family endonuclease
MDFGKILDEWDRQRTIKPPVKNPGKAVKSQATADRTELEGFSADKAKPLTEPKKEPKKEPDGQEYLKRWLLRNAVPDPKQRETDAKQADAVIRGQAMAERIRRMRPQAVLDLHGKTKVEAELAINTFITTAVRQGLEKVLIIHGKGIHSESEPVLASWVQKSLEENPMVGAFGSADKNSGGRGATWARIRSSDYFSR